MPYFLYYTIQDSDGDTSVVEIPIPTTTAVANLIGAVTAMAGLINPLTNGGLVAAGVRLEVDLSGTWGPVAALIADVQEKGEFAFRGENGFLKRLNIPAFLETLFTGAGSTKQIDLGDTDVAAFVTAMEDGFVVGGATIQPVDVRGDDLETLEYAVENWGKRRRR